MLRLDRRRPQPARHRPVRVLIIGLSPLSMELAGRLDAHPRYELVGVVADRLDSMPFGRGLPILGTLADFDRILRRVDPELVVVAPADRRGTLPVGRLLERRIEDGLEVEDGFSFYERLTGAVEVTTLPPATILFSRQFQPSRWQVLSTRVLGVLLSATALLLLSPLIGLIALALAFDRSGPVLFVQERLGLGRRPFKVLKFRTMRPLPGPNSEWIRQNQARVTPLGAWLRRYRLDELPQLVNILKGDMNLVGPRPHPVGNSQILTMLARNLSDVSGVDIPFYSLRCLVRPGITGWAQVRYGYANDFAEELEKLRYDLYYVKHLSLWLDFRILFETVKVVVSGRDTSLLGSEGVSIGLPPIVPRALSRRRAS